jgi:hypothetical protein
MRIRYPGWKKIGSGIRYGKKSDPVSAMEKSRIRDPENISNPQHWPTGTGTYRYRTIRRVMDMMFFSDNFDGTELGSQFLDPWRDDPEVSTDDDGGEETLEEELSQVYFFLFIVCILSVSDAIPIMIL